MLPQVIVGRTAQRLCREYLARQVASEQPAIAHSPAAQRQSGQRLAAGETSGHEQGVAHHGNRAQSRLFPDDQRVESRGHGPIGVHRDPAPRCARAAFRPAPEQVGHRDGGRRWGGGEIERGTDRHVEGAGAVAANAGLDRHRTWSHNGDGQPVMSGGHRGGGGSVRSCGRPVRDGRRAAVGRHRDARSRARVSGRRCAAVGRSVRPRRSPRGLAQPIANTSSTVREAALKGAPMIDPFTMGSGGRHGRPSSDSRSTPTNERAAG